MFEPIKNTEYRSKPRGGFWASPISSKLSWKLWNEQEDFRECNEDNAVKFVLDKSSKVLYIRSVKDLESLPKQKAEIHTTWQVLDFEQILKEGYDAIELNLSDEELDINCEWGEGLYWQLYGWDCDSILILNPDIVYEL
jgi:uncharacterized lipoprotein YmbA